MANIIIDFEKFNPIADNETAISTYPSKDIQFREPTVKTEQVLGSKLSTNTPNSIRISPLAATDMITSGVEGKGKL